MMRELIDEKINLLYDFCILKYKRGKEDTYENAVRKLLAECGTESRMQIVLHDVLLEKTTLTELLKKKGLV